MQWRAVTQAEFERFVAAYPAPLDVEYDMDDWWGYWDLRVSPPRRVARRQPPAVNCTGDPAYDDWCRPRWELAEER